MPECLALIGLGLIVYALCLILAASASSRPDPAEELRDRARNNPDITIF